MRKRLTLAYVNREIKRRGGHEELVYSRSGGPYFYFINVGPHQVPGESIPVSRLNIYTLEQWMRELELAREAEEGK
jgi:hypothetical protein